MASALWGYHVPFLIRRLILPPTFWQSLKFLPQTIIVMMAIIRWLCNIIIPYKLVCVLLTSLPLLLMYYINGLMDFCIIQGVISHCYHIYIDAWIVPNLATGSFFKKGIEYSFKSKFNFAEVTNEICDIVKEHFFVPFSTHV